jgi:ATP-binding cassette, subfamily B, bacterial
VSQSVPEPQLPGPWASLRRAMRLGFRLEPLLLVVGGITAVAAALPDSLFAAGLAWFAAALADGDRARLFASAVALAGLAAGTWLLRLASDRANMLLSERAAVPLEAHVARLQSQITTIEHQERPDYLDTLEVLRDHGAALGQLYRAVFSVAGAVVRLLLTVGLLMSVRPWLGFLAVFAVPSVLTAAHRAAAEQQAEQAGAADRRLARHLFVLGATAASSKELRVAGTQRLVLETRAAAWQRQYRALARERWISALWQAGAWAVFGAAFVGAVIVVAFGHGSRPAAADTVVLVVAAGARLTQYVGQTVSETQLLRAIWLDAARRLAWLEDYSAAQAGIATEPAPNRLRSGIRFDGVCFRYPGAVRPALQDVSLTLPAGGVVAVVGENGAGKSTLVKLLCRLYDPSSGRITVDGTDLALIEPGQWRQRLAGAFQDFFRFEYPAALSVGVGDLPRAGDRGAVGRALARAGAEEVIARLPGGLDAQLGSTWHDGTDLSFGQWQRIALARGFMRDDPLLLVLDEPTAALDAETEHAILARYAEAAGPGGRRSGRITVLVAHRFSTVRMADLIVVLDGARVCESGSHAELMAINGKYAELYRLQQAAYLSPGE